MIARTVALGLALVACGDDVPPPTAAPPTAATLAGDRAARCAAVFELFERQLAPPVTGPAARAVLTDRSWITLDDKVEVLGGKFPVDLTSDDSTFVVHCLAAPRADLGGRLWSDWVIYGRIAGKTAPTLTAFLDAGADVVLLEYALVFPDGRTEHHGEPRGRWTWPAR